MSSEDDFANFTLNSEGAVSVAETASSASPALPMGEGQAGVRRQPIEFALGQLRHAYAKLAAGSVVDQRELASGLIAPTIRRLEVALSSGEPPTGAAGEAEAARKARDEQITQPSHDDEGLIERLRKPWSRLVREGYKVDRVMLERKEAANTISRLKGELDLVAGQLRYVAKSNAVNFDRSLLLEAEVEELRRGLLTAREDLLKLHDWIAEETRQTGRIRAASDMIAKLDRALLSPRLVGVEDEVITSPADPGSAKLRREGEG